MMLISDRFRIAHVTLHLGLRDALDALNKTSISRAIEATNGALNKLLISSPKIAVSGINPHAGEGGMFGLEEIEVITPAIEKARAGGMDIHGPFGADTMYSDPSYDAYVVMYHDQGHIPAKLLNTIGTAAFAIGSPVLFSSVGHGSALDIAGKGIANPIAAILSFAMALRYSLDLDKEANSLEKAVQDVLDEGLRTKDIISKGKKEVSTSQMGDAIISKLQ